MTSRRLRLVGGAMRRLGRAAVARAQDPIKERWRFAQLARFGFRAPRGVPVATDPVFMRGGERALWVGARRGRGARVILHFHGGAYLMGSPRTHWKVVGRLSLLSGLAVFLPHYRLAPEHPLPAAMQDARAAWDHLLALGYKPCDIVLGGDSAGGGIALSLLAALGAQGVAPAALYLWSPFADLTFSGASVTANADSEHFFPVERVQELPAMILGGTNAADPAVSPVFAKYSNPPPALIQASADEILRDDAVRAGDRLRAAGGAVTLRLVKDVPHAWQLFDGWFPEARAAIAETAAFIKGLQTPAAGRR